MTLHIPTAFNIETYDSLAALGFCSGPRSEGRVCVQVAISRAINGKVVLNGPEDSPNCVSVLDNSCSIGLNDCEWTSPQARASALRDLGLVQLGTTGTPRSLWKLCCDRGWERKFLPAFCRFLAWQLIVIFFGEEKNPKAACAAELLVDAASLFEKGHTIEGRSLYREASDIYSESLAFLGPEGEPDVKWLPAIDLSELAPWQLHNDLIALLQTGDLNCCEVTDALLCIAVEVVMEAYALEGRTPEAVRALCRREA